MMPACAHKSVLGGRYSNRPKRRGKFSAAAAVLVAGLALGFGCKNRTPERRPERVEKVNKHPTAPPNREVRPAIPKIRSMKTRKIIRKGDVLLNIKFDDGHSSPFLKVKRIDRRGVTVGPRMSNLAMTAFVMTAYENDLFNAARAYTRFGNSWKVSTTLKFGKTRRFIFKERKWSLVIRADRRKRRGTALITATVDSLD